MADQKIKVIIFDMGGVLIKTVDRKNRSELAGQFHMSYEELDHLVYETESARKAAFGEISEQDHFVGVLKHLGAPDFGIQKFQEAFWGGDELDQELVNFISAHKGTYRFGMLSNAMSDIRKWLNSKYDFLQLFDIVFFSAEQKLAKPDPLFYQAILREFKVTADEAIFIDDFIENIAAARSLGIHSVHYRTTQQALLEVNQLLNQYSP
jgi:epoxide hydrolase-like predicted phosphatase